MNFDGLMPRIEQPRGIGEPRREIELDAETEKLAESSIETLDQSGFEVTSIFEIFHDWKSRQTIAARRALLSVSVIVGGSYWIGIDLSQASIWGLSLGDASLDRFLILVSVIHLASATLYMVSRQLDSRVRSAKIVRTTEMIEPCRKAARALEQIAKEKGLNSVGDLIEDFSGFPSVQPTAQDSYDAVRFYENELENAHTVRKSMDVAEFVCVLAVALYTLYAIGEMAWPGTV